MAGTFEVRTDFTELERLGASLASLNGAVLGEVTRDTVNAVVDRTYAFSRKQMNAGINLTDQYVASKMRVEYASSTTNPSASIIARGDLTPLDRFGAYTMTREVTWSNDRIRSMGKTFGAWPGWTKRKGDALRGIPVDQKSSSVAVTVSRGAPKPLGKNAFRMPLKNGAGMGVFIRQGDKVQHKYGPSPYALFRHVVNENIEHFGDDLQSSLGDALAAEAAKRL